MRIVTLTTDFGSSDAYAAAVKAVILSQNRDVQLVDITHQVPPQDILSGRLALGDVWHYFPKGTIHLAVVDPEVGTDRHPVIVEADGHLFVGPDNGLLGFTLACRKKKFWIIRQDLIEGEIRPTFAGRDLFAPVVGKLSSGALPSELGKRLELIRDFDISEPRMMGAGVQGEVLTVDRFGNLITNLTEQWKKKDVRVTVGKTKIVEVSRCYADVSPGSLLALWNSSGRLEIAVRDGSAAAFLGKGKGTKVFIGFRK